MRKLRQPLGCNSKNQPPNDFQKSSGHSQWRICSHLYYRCREPHGTGVARWSFGIAAEIRWLSQWSYKSLRFKKTDLPILCWIRGGSCGFCLSSFKGILEIFLKLIPKHHEHLVPKSGNVVGCTWANCNDLSRGHLKRWFSKGILPKMAFRLRIYNELPRLCWNAQWIFKWIDMNDCCFRQENHPELGHPAWVLGNISFSISSKTLILFCLHFVRQRMWIYIPTWHLNVALHLSIDLHRHLGHNGVENSPPDGVVVLLMVQKSGKLTSWCW